MTPMLQDDLLLPACCCTCQAFHFIKSLLHKVIMGVALNFTVEVEGESQYRTEASPPSIMHFLTLSQSFCLVWTLFLIVLLNTPLKIYILPALRRQTIESDVHFPCVLSVLCRGSQHSQSPFTVIRTSLLFHNDSSNVFGTDNQSTDNQSAFAVDICYSYCDTACVETDTSVITVII